MPQQCRHWSVVARCEDGLFLHAKRANKASEPGLTADCPNHYCCGRSGEAFQSYVSESVGILGSFGTVSNTCLCTTYALAFPALRCTSLQGQKRLVLSESCSRDSMSSQPSCTGLNYSYGVNAWKCWVQTKYAGGESSKGEELRFGRKCYLCPRDCREGLQHQAAEPSGPGKPVQGALESSEPQGLVPDASSQAPLSALSTPPPRELLPEVDLLLSLQLSPCASKRISWPARLPSSTMVLPSSSRR